MFDKEIEALKSKQPYYNRPKLDFSVKACSCPIEIQIGKRAEIEYKQEGGRSIWKMSAWCIVCGLQLTTKDTDRLFGQPFEPKVPKNTDGFNLFLKDAEERGEEEDGSSFRRKS